MIKEKHPNEAIPICYYCIHSNGLYLTSIGMRVVSKENSNSEHKSANKVLHRMLGRILCASLNA